MEVRHNKRLPAVRQARNRHELIVRLWVEFGQPPVGAHLLNAIQRQLAEDSGDDIIDSPAAIARILADEGAELRHPDVIDFDVAWRRSRVKATVSKFDDVEQLVSGKRLNLSQAATLFATLEGLRQEFERNHDDAGLRELRLLVGQARQRVLATAKNRAANDVVRGEQAELAEWFTVWLQTPALFEDWLELRRKSEEFCRKFPQT